ncbi:hypothetical protein MRX96_048010 [Rhipicephalus microplus]
MKKRANSLDLPTTTCGLFLNALPFCNNSTHILSGETTSNASIFSTSDAETTFSSAKKALANATLPVHPKGDAFTSLTVDASDVAIGAVLQQLVDGGLAAGYFLLTEALTYRASV